MGTALRNTALLKFVKDCHLEQYCLSFVAASGLELKPPDDAILTTLGPDI